MADRVLFKVVVPTVVGVLALLLVVIGLEKNTELDFGSLGELASFVWFIVGVALVVGVIVAAIRFFGDQRG